MPTTMKDLGIDRMSIDDRLALVEEIWNSIADSSNSLPLTEAQKVMLDRRMADLDANPNNALTWDEIKERQLIRSGLSMLRFVELCYTQCDGKNLVGDAQDQA